MAVNLSDAEIRQFELAGITKEQIGKTIERDRAAGLSDEDITLKAMMKADQLEKDNPAFEGSIARGSLRTISNLPFGDTINRGIQGTKAFYDAYMSIPSDAAKAAYDATLDYVTGNNKPTIRQYLEAPEGTTPPDRSWNQLYKDKYNELRKDRGESFSENYTKNMNKLERTFKEQNYDVPKLYRWLADAGVTIGSYGFLPEGIYETVPRAAAFGAADAYQSGINKDSKDRMINALIGGVTTGALTGIMNKVTGKSAMRQAEKEYPLLADGFEKNPPKTTEEAFERIVDNFFEKSKNSSLTARVNEEANKLFGNMDTKTFTQIVGKDSAKQWKTPLGKAYTKKFKSTLNEFGSKVRANGGMSGEEVKKTIEEMTAPLNDLLKVTRNTKPNTEGLAGGITGFLAGNWVGGPVGGIAGALLGSKGKIGNALAGVGELLAGKSGQRLTKAMVNPQGTNAIIRALRKAPGLTNVVQKATVPVIQNSYEEDKTSYLPSKQYKKTTKQTTNTNPNTIPLNLPGTTIILPDDNNESIMEKHLKLLTALYPNFYGKVA